jgi:hypothetical protein
MSEVWLPIADYSIKHKVSISTLRRRIKGADISFRFEDGKYLILDAPAESMARAHRPSLNSDHDMGQDSGTVNSPALGSYSFNEPVASAEPLITSAPPLKKHLPFLHAEQVKHQNAGQEVVQALLSEIKKAYALILAEKEEQILQLKEEVSDLKTLTRILESELDRARGL